MIVLSRIVEFISHNLYDVVLRLVFIFVGCARFIVSHSALGASSAALGVDWAYVWHGLDVIFVSFAT